MRMKLINRIKKFAQFALAFGLVSSASADQYFKFVVTHRNANPQSQYVEFGELALFNAEGGRVNRDLSNDATLSGSNTFSYSGPGEVTHPDPSQNEVADNLFDGTFGGMADKFCCQLNTGDQGKQLANQPIIIMRLTTDDEIVAYNLASAEKIYSGARFVTGWELYRSDDGQDWTLVDKRLPAEIEKDPVVSGVVAWTWYNNGGTGVNGKNPTTAYRIGGGSVTSWHFLDLLASDPRRVVSSPLATGGDIILKDGDDYIHVFTNAAAASTFTAKESLNARVLVVGGGGAGGYNCAGGGGAGAVIVHPSYSITEGSILSVKVGAGGAAPTVNAVGGSGGASVIRSDNEVGSLIYQADGGGGGATWGESTPIAAGDGGCGGGGATANNDNQGTWSAGSVGGVTECTMPPGATKYGCAGGRGWRAGPSDDGAGGGGGAQTQGANGAHNIPGKGGDGVVCTILGGGLLQQAFGGGGGGGGSVNNTIDKNPASGGTGGGGAGGYNKGDATSGEDGLGGGGGGGNGGANTASKPARGGSGLVVIRYSTMRDRWYRLVITHRNTASTSTQGTIQLSELALFNAAGKRLNSGLVKSSEASLPVGSCSVSGGDLASTDEDVDNLFDGDGGTKLCVTSLGNAAELSPHLVITMHLATDEPVVGYNMESGKDTGNNDGMWPRAPKSWILYSSLDGEHWAAIDKRTADDDDAALKSNCRWYNSGNAEGENAYTLTGLTPISYVASDGTQYVDTLYKPNAKTRVVLDYEMTEESGAYLFGFAGNNNGKSLFSRNAPGSSSMSVCRDDDFNTVVEISGSTDVGGRHVLDVGTTAILLDGVAQPNYPTAHPLSASCEGSAFLFALNQGWYPGPGKPWTDGAWVSMRVYSLKFYEDDELVFDAVPMLDAAGTPGLYDNVSGRFLTSANATPLLAPNCYYKVGLDSDQTGASFAKSANSTCGWSETRGGTVIANHNVSSEYEYYVDSGLVLYTTHEAAADETFAGASLVLRGTLAMKGRGNTVTVNRLIAKGGVIGQWYKDYTQKLAGSISIAEGDSLTLRVTGPTSDRRDLTIASAISGAGDLILSAPNPGQGTIVLLSGDNAEFTGTIKTPDAFNNPLTLQVTGDFGGTITSLPAAEKVNAIAFNYDGLAGGSGLRVIGSEFPAALKTKLTLFSATTDFNQMNLPLVTFPAGQFLQASDFTVKHATSVDGSGTAFTGLAIIPNGDGTETLVANAASGIYFVTAEATAGTGTGLSWLSPLTLQEAFDKISAATSETAGQGKQYIIYLKVGTYKNTNGPWTFSPTMSWVFVKGGYSGSGLERADTACSVFDGDDARGLFSVTAITTGAVWDREIVYEQLDFRNAQTAVKIATGTAANNVGNYHQIFRRCRFINNTVPSGSSAKGSAIEVDGGNRPCWICADTCEFRGNTAFNDDGTTIWSGMQTTDNVVNSVEFVNSLFVGNRSKRRPCVAQIRVSPQNPNVIKSCTFAYNSVEENADSEGATGGIVLDEKAAASSGAQMTMTMKNSIFYGNRCANAVGADYKSTLAAGLQFLDHLMFESATGAGGYNVDCLLTGDPLFVTPLASASSEADVHLKSVGGRWNGSAWVKDDAMSPAIDAGDPKADYSLEPSPNGGRINLGAYGNTAEASKSVAETDAATVSSASGYSEIKQLDNGHTVLIFSNVTDAASFTVAKGGYARVLVVGGGGSGGSGGNGYGGGGGGAGGVVASDAQMLDAGEYTVVVGNSAKDSSLKNSADTVLITAVGGGAGGAGNGSNPGANGGSGGGGGGFSSGCSGGEGVSGQGNAGGYNSYYAGGGGGGFSSAGKSASNNLVGGDGGNGYASDITGEMYGYACGGGGSGSNSGSTQTMGVGGSVTVDGVKLILGGNGSKEKGGDAVSGTGSGGGGGCNWQNGGKGGSGIVVVHLYTTWAPPIGSEVTISEVTATSAKVAVNVIGIGASDSARAILRWGTTENCTEGAKFLGTIGGAAQFEQTLSGLLPGTNYHVRVCLELDDGTNKSTPETFATAAVEKSAYANLSGVTGAARGEVLADGSVIYVFTDTNAAAAASFTLSKGGYARLLVVGGGGAGGDHGHCSATGGGGGGQVIDHVLDLAAGTYGVTVGAGGIVQSGVNMHESAYYPGASSTVRLAGASSTVLEALGGGGGGNSSYSGGSGANGGGGSVSATWSPYHGGGGAGSVGFAGGDAWSDKIEGGDGNHYLRIGGGGGGAGGFGGSPHNVTEYGAGGMGLYSSILGLGEADDNAWFGGGGGGGKLTGSAPTVVPGGRGGGATTSSNDQRGVCGKSGTGGGGAGGTTSAQTDLAAAYYSHGGSGIVVLRIYGTVSVPVALNANGGTGGTTEVTATVGQPMPTPITLPTRPGYTFQGYGAEGWEVKPMTGEETDVINEGTSVYAYCPVSINGGYTINGVEFTSTLTTSSTTSGNVTFSESMESADGQSGTEGKSGGYGNLMTHKIRSYIKADPTLTITLSGLTANRSYLMQLVCHEGVSGYDIGYKINGVDYKCNSQKDVNVKYGRSFVLRFWTTETTYSFTMARIAEDTFHLINAIQVRDITETQGSLKYYNDDGSSARTYPANGLTELFAMWTRALPPGYEPLDCLNNGSDIATAGFVQIDGFHLAGSNVVELKYNVNAEKASGYQDIFMARAYLDGQTNLDNLAEFGLGRNTVANPTQLSFTYGKRKNPTSNVVKITNVDAMYTGVDVVARLCSSQEKCLFGGVPLSGTAFPAAYTEALPCDLFIFSSADYNECNDYAHVGHANDPTLHAVALVKMYYFKVMASATDLTPRLDLVPASNTVSHAVGLYDLVGREFYPLRHPCPGATVVDGHAVDEWHHADPSLTACGYDCGVCTSCLMRISKMIPPVQGDREWRWNGQPHRPHITETNDYWGVAGCAISYNPSNTEWTGEKTFTMTNMLVNPCVWLDGTTTNVVYTYTCLPAFFSVIRPGGPQIEVKKSWLNYAYKNIQDYDEYQDFLFSTNANGVAAWQAYVLGVGATKAAVEGAAIVEESVQNANPDTVTIKLRDWETLTPRTNENCRLAYSLLSARTTSELLANGGTVVTNKCVSPNVPYEKCQEWSFEAPLSDLTDEESVNYYRIKVHFIFDK